MTWHVSRHILIRAGAKLRVHRCFISFHDQYWLPVHCWQQIFIIMGQLSVNSDLSFISLQHWVQQQSIQHPMAMIVAVASKQLRGIPSTTQHFKPRTSKLTHQISFSQLTSTPHTTLLHLSPKPSNFSPATSDFTPHTSKPTFYNLHLTRVTPFLWPHTSNVWQGS